MNGAFGQRVVVDEVTHFLRDFVRMLNLSAKEKVDDKTKSALTSGCD